MKLIKTVSAAVLTLIMAAGCTPVRESAPEPEPENIQDGVNTQVIRMPDGFRNIAFTCHGTTGLYVTSRGWVKDSVSQDLTPLPSAVTAIPDHPQCTGGRR